MYVDSSVGIAHLVPLDLGDERLDEGVVDLLVDVDALDRAARLAGVVERAVGDAGGGGSDVDVVADVHRVLAAELELHLDHLAAGLGADAGAGRIRAGEEHAVDRLVEQRRAASCRHR